MVRPWMSPELTRLLVLCAEVGLQSWQKRQATYDYMWCGKVRKVGAGLHVLARGVFAVCGGVLLIQKKRENFEEVKP